MGWISKAALIALLVGCARGDDRQCALMPASVVAQHPGMSFDGVAAAGTTEGVLSAWSDPGGLWLKRLDAMGKPAAAPLRIAARCLGGIDLASAGPRAFVGCSRPGSEADAGVWLYELDAGLSVTRSVQLGAAGRDGRGVDIEPGGDAVYAVFHDGTVAEHRVREAIVRDAALTTRALSQGERAAAGPSLTVFEGHRYAVWSETELGQADKSRTAVWIARDDAAPRELTRTEVHDPAPRIAHDGEGLFLAFRDRKKRDKRPELYAARLTADLRLAGASAHVGRANSDGPPSLHVCGPLRVALMPREYGGERYVGVHALDGALQNLGAGHQFYANSREFVQVGGACGTPGLVLLTAERASPATPGVEILSMRFDCAAP